MAMFKNYIIAHALSGAAGTTNNNNELCGAAGLNHVTKVRELVAGNLS